MQSAICGTSVGIQIWLTLLSSFFQPSCVQAVTESVKHMTEICSLLKLLIVQHLECTADWIAQGLYSNLKQLLSNTPWLIHFLINCHKIYCIRQKLFSHCLTLSSYFTHLPDHNKYTFLLCVKDNISFLGRQRRPYIVFRNRVLYGFMFVTIYIYMYLSPRWRRSGSLHLLSLKSLSFRLHSPMIKW